MWKALRQIVTETLWANWAGKCFSIIAVVATITGFTLKEFIDIQTVRNLNWSLWISIILAIILVRILYVYARQLKEIEIVKNTSYTPSKLIKHLKDISTIQNACILEVPNARPHLIELCNKLRDCMNKLTDSNCCVSIKIIEGDKDGSFDMTYGELLEKKVTNIARDNNHGSRDTKEYMQRCHFISENTAYLTIVAKLHNSKQLFYRCNDVSSDNDYMTSSPYEPGEIPYKSELVFAISKKVNNKNNVKGFVCIDSEKKNAFGKDSIFVDIANIVADNLSNVL